MLSCIWLHAKYWQVLVTGIYKVSGEKTVLACVRGPCEKGQVGHEHESEVYVVSGASRSEQCRLDERRNGVGFPAGAKFCIRQAVPLVRSGKANLLYKELHKSLPPGLKRSQRAVCA
jgi:hypothetical protein